jgi:5'-nucleotidase
MRILITNDDGIFADGMLTLARALEQEHEVHIVAPDTQRSAQSHAITILEPMTIKNRRSGASKDRPTA